MSQPDPDAATTAARLVADYDLLIADIVNEHNFPGAWMIRAAACLRQIPAIEAQVNARWEQRIRDLTGGRRIGWTHNKDLMNLLEGDDDDTA